MPIQDLLGRTVYVTGFLFATTPGLINGTPIRWVALIRKNRPEWQAGLLNGIGGKMEPGDLTLARALVREVAEEARFDTTPGQWQEFAQVRSARSLVHFFRADLGMIPYQEPDDPRESARLALPRLHNEETGADEPCEWYPVNTLAGEKVVPSLGFLIPLAENPEFRETVTQFTWTDLPRPGEGS